MDCKDLMVGDLVNVNGLNLKVSAIHADEIGVVDPDYKIYWCSDDEFDRIDPIPLTEEILVKNGFEYERNIGYIFDDYDGNVVIYDDYNNRLKILQNHDVSFNREFFSKVCVHYLQHALRLCEIRKEIEL